MLIFSDRIWLHQRGWPSWDWSAPQGRLAGEQAAMADFRKGRKMGEDDGDNFYMSEGEKQQLLLQEQDETLSALKGGINRMGHLALSINEELDSQNRMIEGIDDHIDKTESSLGGLQKKLKALAADSDSGKYCTVCFLTVVLVVLFWLVINDE
jgi:syntaxin 6